MAPMIDIPNQEDFEKIKNVADTFEINYTIPKDITIITNKTSDKYIELPESGLLVPKERTLFNKNFYETQKALHKEGSKMLTPYEFIEFLKIVREQDSKLYQKITEVRSPWRAEWLDADFKWEGDQMYVVYHIFDENGNIKQKKEKLDKNTLMDDRTPGINLDSWLENPTPQGLPRNSTDSGDLYYWTPDKDNNSVARFDAGSDGAVLVAGRGPSGRSSILGVRAAKQLE